MRLTPYERDQITAAARRHFGTGVRVVLFGSRVDDQARGGDIDLMIETPQQLDRELERKARFLMDLWQHIGEQRVDVVFRTPAKADEDIHRIADALGVSL